VGTLTTYTCKKRSALGTLSTTRRYTDHRSLVHAVWSLESRGRAEEMSKKKDAMKVWSTLPMDGRCTPHERPAAH